MENGLKNKDTKERFEIFANTYTLLSSDPKKTRSVLEDGVKYEIPIFQRPYSWTEEQVEKLISDIFDSYWGNDQEILEEPMFIGTMQLSERDSNNQHQIIDGQQRLTTLLILLKVLKTRYSKRPNPRSSAKNIRRNKRIRLTSIIYFHDWKST